MEETAKKAEPKPTTIEGKVGAFYKSFMDESADRESRRFAR